MPVAAIKPRNAVESLRDIVQDLLVPELKAIKVQTEASQSEMRASVDALRTEVRLLHDQTMQAIKFLDEKFSASADTRERLAVLEDRIKRN